METIQLSCECKRLIPKYSIEPSTAAVNWFFQKDEGKNLELIAFQEKEPPKIPKSRIIVKGGGDAYYPGAQCSIPFVQDMKIQYSCLNSGRDDGRCYCAINKFENRSETMINLDKEEQGQQWGFCGCARPTPGWNMITIRDLSSGVTGNSGEKCVFPFKYKNRLHFECIVDLDTPETGGRCFCGVRYDLDEFFDFGLCPCPKTPLIGEWSNWNDWARISKNVERRTRHCQQPYGIDDHKAFCEGSFYEKRFVSGFTGNHRHKFAVDYDQNLINVEPISEGYSGKFFCSDSSESVDYRHLLSEFNVNVYEPLDGIILDENSQWGCVFLR